MILNGVNAVLKDANVTIEETADALTGLQNAQEELKDLMVLFDDFTAEVPNALATLSQAQTGRGLTFLTFSYITFFCNGYCLKKLIGIDLIQFISNDLIVSSYG